MSPKQRMEMDKKWRQYRLENVLTEEEKDAFDAPVPSQIKRFMTKNPIRVEKDTLAAKALNIMNEKKITSLCVYKKGNIKKTIGIIHIHNILSSDIN